MRKATRMPMVGDGPCYCGAIVVRASRLSLRGVVRISHPMNHGERQAFDQKL